jgi:hypothetical protein
LSFIARSPADLKEKIVMSNEKVDYVALLSDLEAKKAALEASIATLRSAMALGLLGQTPEGIDLSAVAATSAGPAENAVPTELPHHAFLGMSLPAAIKMYLQAAKKKQTIKEIAAALREHGMESTSDNFEGVVTGSLNRLKGAGDVLRFKDGWGLSAWYPAFRSQAASAAKPARKSAKKRGSKKKKQEPQTEAKAEPAKPSLPTRIAELLNQRDVTALSKEQIARALGNPGGLHLILAGMVARKTIVKTESGLYMSSPSNVREMAAAG